MASDKRVKVTLACSECKQRNYNTMKNKKNDPDRLEMNKYCRFCKKHTSHKETRPVTKDLSTTTRFTPIGSRSPRKLLWRR